MVETNADYLHHQNTNENIQRKIVTGSLATSCNPSCGTALFRWIWSTGLVWSNPDHEKGDRLIAGHLRIHPTTQQLYQGAGDAGKTRPEEPL